jgi:tetratricopeptide (TPR) repeat protein
MPPKATRYGFFERLKIGKILRPVTEKYGANQEKTGPNALQEAIHHMEKAAQEKPDEWVYWYALAEWYQIAGDPENLLAACHKCFALAPQDIRSSYSLAAAYNDLTKKDWTGQSEELFRIMEQHRMQPGNSSPAQATQEPLRELDAAVEGAAALAEQWLEHALTLKPEPASRQLIQTNIEDLLSRFPQLAE